MRDPAIIMWSTWQDREVMHCTQWLSLIHPKAKSLIMGIHHMGVCRVSHQTLPTCSTPTITRHSLKLRYQWTLVECNIIIKVWFIWHLWATLRLRVKCFQIQLSRVPRLPITGARIVRPISRNQLMRVSSRRSLFNKKIFPRWGSAKVWSKNIILKHTFNLAVSLRLPNPVSRSLPPTWPSCRPHPTQEQDQVFPLH